MDSDGNQLNVFQRNYSSKYSQGIPTNNHPNNVNQNYSTDNFRLSVKLDPNLYLRKIVPLLAKKYILKPVKKVHAFSSQKSNHEDLPLSQKLHESKVEHNLKKLVNDKGSLVSKLSIKRENQDLRNPVKVHETNNLQKPIQTDSTFHLQNPIRTDSTYLQRPVQINFSHNLQNQIFTRLKTNLWKVFKWAKTHDSNRTIMLPVDDFRNPIQIQPTNDFRKPVQTDITFYLPKTMQVDPSHDLRQVVKVSDTRDLRMLPKQRLAHYLRNSGQVHTINNLREPVKTDSTYHIQKPVQVDPSHNLRKVVKVSDSHDLRWPLVEESDHDLRNPVQVLTSNYLLKPVQTDSTFYLQKPVQTDSTFYLQKPVQTDSTFYLQKPVQVDSSHDLRKAVKVADSHDLRWPTVQEPDHDLRNPVAEIEYFRSENAETKLEKIIQAYINNISTDGKNKENHDPIYELLHEDVYIKSNCPYEFWSLNSSISENRSLENRDIKASQQKVLFRDSTKACGIPYNKSSENFDFHERNSSMGPWMVSVQEYIFGKFIHKCGGSLLNNLWVITAAHCVDLRPKWDFLLKLGIENNGKSQTYIERFVNKISIHPKYSNINFDNDLALLRMELPVTFNSNIVPICLPDVHESMEKRKALVFGWQVATSRKMSSGAAQAEIVPVLTNKECEVMFSETGVNESIEKNFVCAGTRSVKESCTGDSGGPLAVSDARGRWSLAGLYSWGKTCKIPNQPEVYISVASYVNWIEDTIACFEHYINLGRINS